MPWLIDDPLGRTFLVFPLFAAAMIGMSLSRSLYAEDIVRRFAPVVYLLILWAVLLHAARAYPLQRATNLLSELLEVMPLVIAVTIGGLALVPVVYLLELALAHKWLSWREGRRARILGRSVVVPVGTSTVELHTPMDADESFALVQEMSRKPVWFGLFSIVVAIGEELLYRGLMFEQLRDLGSLSIAGGVAIQAGAYALNHVPFGVAAFIGKFFAGLAFCALVLVSGSLYPAVAAHLLLQLLVWRRLRRLDLVAEGTVG